MSLIPKYSNSLRTIHSDFSALAAAVAIALQCGTTLEKSLKLRIKWRQLRIVGENRNQDSLDSSSSISVLGLAGFIRRQAYVHIRY